MILDKGSDIEINLLKFAYSKKIAFISCIVDYDLSMPGKNQSHKFIIM